MHQKKSETPPHVPVLLSEVLEMLNPQAGDVYLDNTAGYGGHAAAILSRTHNAPAVLIDRDQAAIDWLKTKFTSKKTQLVHGDYLAVARQLQAESRQFDLILADLGMSSPHLKQASRGFAISLDGPLDMRMDQRQPETAATIVNSYSAAELAQLLREYGQEPKARAIARRIVAHRPLRTTKELARIAASVWPSHRRLHPATRTFQALRIAVNDELGILKQTLPLWIELLRPGGRLALISFHSLEDALVKQALAEAAVGYEAQLSLLNKRPISAGPSEIAKNPRARSAKLRAAVKINSNPPKIQRNLGG